MTRSQRAPRGVLAVASVTLFVFAAAALLLDTVAVDRAVRDHLLAAASPGVVAFLRVVNVAGNWKFLLPATLVLLAGFDRARRTWWVWIALMVLAPLLEGTLKIVIGRARPESAAYGFPSGHATAAAAYFGALIYLSEALAPPWRAIARGGAVVMMLLVGIARIVLRAHWPSDVAGGLALGLALASLATLVAAGVVRRPPA